MKRTFSVIALALSLSLTACSKEETTKNIFNIQQKMAGKDGRAITLPPPVAPQPPEFPTEAEIQAKIAENLAYINSKIVEKDGKTTYYFAKQKDKDGKNTYPLTDDKNKADYYRVILGKTADGYCAVQDFYANGKKQMEPFIEQDINYCNRFDGNGKPHDSLIIIYYDKEQKITSFSYFDITNKQRFLFGYVNGNEAGVVISDFSNSPKITAFDMNDIEHKSTIKIFEFNEYQIVKFTSFWYQKANLKDIDYVLQYNFLAEEKKEFLWFPQTNGNIATYFDNDPEYEKNNKEFFNQAEKAIKQAQEEFNFYLSQNSNNQ